MTDTETSPRTTPQQRAEPQSDGRILARLDHGRPGPTFLAQAAIHGNEPAGIEALRRVAAWLERSAVPLHGRFVACVGNLQAVARGHRYLERDLNRQWLPESTARLQARDAALDTAEDTEQRALLALYEELDASRGAHALVFLDLHTSSAAGAPFVCMADTVPNRRIADAIPLPMILGLEECIDGAVMEWFNQRRQVGLAIEGGRHDALGAVDNLEATIWLALRASGVLAPTDTPDLAPHRCRLRAAAHGTPHILEIRHRQAITPNDGFAMMPGYASFQPVTKGELLAHDARGPLRAPLTGRILLPLYQGLGEDGFFVGRRVKRFWFELSAAARRLPARWLLPLLPGVRHDPDYADTLLVDTRLARLLVVQVFHLFGFRRRRARGPRLLAFTRRRAAPEAWRLRPRAD